MWILQESLIGKQKKVKCGVIAIETLLGWTLIEKVDTTATKEDTTFMVVSIFTCQENVANLWKLDTLGYYRSYFEEDKRYSSNRD